MPQLADPECFSPYITDCVPPTGTVTTTTTPRDIPVSGSDATGTVGLLGTIILVIGFILAITARRRRTHP